MNKILPIIVFVVFGFAITFGMLRKDEVKANVTESSNRFEHWLTNKIWEAKMQSQGLKRNEDKGGVYFTDN
jgi:amino acid permease